MTFAKFSTVLAACLAFATLTGCDGRRESREILNMPDMHWSIAQKAQEPNLLNMSTSSNMLPVPGTIPVGWEPYPYNTVEEADFYASKIENPLPRTEEVLKAGQKYFGIYCTPCHGSAGDGSGKVIAAGAGMPQPPSLFTDKVAKEWTDGRIFHVITRGQGNMPSYAARVDADKRWAIIHYVRALQKAHRPADAPANAQASAAK